MSEKKYPIPGGLVEKPEIDFDSPITKRWKLPFFLGFAWGWFYISGLNVKTFTQLVDSTPYWNLIIVGWTFIVFVLKKAIIKFRSRERFFYVAMKFYHGFYWVWFAILGFYVTRLCFLY